MKNKIIGILVCLMLVTTTIVFVPEKMNVKASSGRGAGDNELLDTQYIYDISYNLSRVIFNAYGENEIAKGRAFGTKGEWAAKTLIYENFSALGLDTSVEQFESITSLFSEDKRIELTDKLETMGQRLNINNSGDVIEVKDFFIGPRWNSTFRENWISPHKGIFDFDYDEELLSHNFSYNGLKVVRRPKLLWMDQIASDIIDNIIDGLTDDEIAENGTLNNFYNFSYEIIKTIEQQNNTNLSNLDEISPTNESLPWYNDTIAGLSDEYVLIDEDPFFNPDVNLPPGVKILQELNPICDIGLFYSKFKLMLQLWWHHAHKDDQGKGLCRGLILYDFNNDTYDMVWTKDTALPILFINKTNGEDIYNDASFLNSFISQNYTIDYYINQSFNQSTVSYNVIGKIDGKDTSRTAIISSLYDSWWCQGTADSAIGMAMVMAIAKYMKDNNIQPKYTTKFIAFGGEEHGFRGGYYYEALHSDENIVSLIDLNQLCFTQTDPLLPTQLLIPTNKLLMRSVLWRILEDVRYDERSEDDTKLKVVYMPNGSPSNDKAFGLNRSGILPFDRRICKTVTFYKDTNWTRHHRDGVNNTEGDVMDYYDPSDINLTGEMILNISKFFTIDPDCWFEGDITYETSDSETEDINDFNETVNVTFTINTSIPQDKVLVKVILRSTEHPILCSYTNEKHYIVTPDTVTDTLSITLPKWAAKGDYTLQVHIYNSTGDIILDTLDTLHLDLEVLDSFVELFGIEESILANILEVVFDHGLGLGALEFFRDKIVDYLHYKGFHIFSDDYKDVATLDLHPPNDAPDEIDTPSLLIGGSSVKAGIPYWLYTSATDPNNEWVRYQWQWTDDEYGIKQMMLHPSGSTHYRRHTWDAEDIGSIQVRVRAADRWLSPNVWSDWSESLPLTVSQGCSASNILNYVIKGSSPTFYGHALGGTEPFDYDWIVSDSAKAKQYYNDTQNLTCTYTEIDDYIVTLNVTDDNGNHSEISHTIHSVMAIAGYTTSSLGTQPNTTLTFNDTSQVYNHITNWTWNFDDGNISYSQNTSHNFITIGEYNVTLTVTDNESNNDTFYQLIHVEITPPQILAITSTPTTPIVESLVTICADFFDNQSELANITLKLIYPDGSKQNFTMNTSESNTDDYEFIFTDTQLSGDYYYSTWATDHANNTNYSAGHSFTVKPTIGYTDEGITSENIEDRISGSIFKVYEYGSANNITAYIKTDPFVGVKPKYQCLLYRANDSKFISATENWTKTGKMATFKTWITFNFTEPPVLEKDTKYVLCVWANNSQAYTYYDVVAESHGRYQNRVFENGPLDTASFTNESRLYSIYCSYTPDTTPPTIANVSNTPVNTSYFNSTYTYYTVISVDVTDSVSGVDNVKVEIIRPNGTTLGNYTMTHTSGNTYEYNHTSNSAEASAGLYNYTVWAEDNASNSNTSDVYDFTVCKCGDIDNSGDGPDISDLNYLVDYMFSGGPPPPPPMCRADVDGSGSGLDISDLNYLVDYMFTSGPPPVNNCCPWD